MKPWSDFKNKCLVGVEDGVPLFADTTIKLTSLGFEVWAKVPQRDVHQFDCVKSKFQLDVKFIIEDEMWGTGSRTVWVANKNPKRGILVVAGDAWYGEGALHKMALLNGVRRTAECVYLLTELPPLDRNEWRGIIQVTFDGYVKRIHEVWKPGIKAMKNCSFQFNAAAVHVAPKSMKNFGANPTNLDLMKDVLPRFISEGGIVETVPLNVLPKRMTADLGTPSRYVEYILHQYGKRAGLILNGADSLSAAESILRARRVFTAGNGGSLCVAQHAALDWSKAGKKPTMCFGDASRMSAYANDVGATHLFTGHLFACDPGPEDLLVLFSVSGESPNMRTLALAAKCPVISVTTSNESSLALTTSKQHVLVETPFDTTCGTWDYGPAEDWMSNWMHGVTAVLEGLKPL